MSRKSGRGRASRLRSFSRLRALPWAVLLQAGMAFAERWRSLAPKDRERLGQLLRATRGRPGSLTPGEREELRRLVGKLDLKGMGRELVPLLRPRGRKRR